MFKTYLRLLGFAKPISKYAVPYFFFTALHALFNTFNYAMIIPILNTMFLGDGKVLDVQTTPELSFKGEALQQWLSYAYIRIFDAQPGELMDTFQITDTKETTFSAAHTAGYYIVEVQTETEKVSLRYVVK